MKTHKYSQAFCSNAWAEHEWRIFSFALNPEQLEALSVLSAEAASSPEKGEQLQTILAMSDEQRAQMLSLLHNIRGEPMPRSTVDELKETAEITQEEAHNYESALINAEARRKFEQDMEDEIQRAKIKEEALEKELEEKKKNNSWLGIGLENPSEKQNWYRFALGTGAVSVGAGILAAAAPALKSIPIARGVSAGVANAIGTSASGVANFVTNLHSAGGLGVGAAGLVSIPVIAVGGLWLVGKTMAKAMHKEAELKKDTATMAKLDKYGLKEHLLLGISAPAHIAKSTIDLLPTAMGNGIVYTKNAVVASGKMAVKGVTETAKATGSAVKWGAVVGGATALAAAPFGAATLGIPAAMLGGAYGIYKWWNKK